MRFIIYSVIAILANCGSAFGQAQHWLATSTTAMAITGNIIVEDERIVFEGGEAIGIRPLADHVPGVYEVTPPANPVLKNGNRLCGDRAPTYIALAPGLGEASLASSSKLHLKIYIGEDVPPASAAKGMSSGGAGFCALMNYERMDAPPADTDQQASTGPSFDCDLAGSSTERAICAVPLLSQLDVELANSYSTRFEQANQTDQIELRNAQRRWISSRNRCGADIECLERRYRERISILQ